MTFSFSTAFSICSRPRDKSWTAGFAKTLLSIHLEGETQNRPLELVTVSADALFEFPSVEFFKDLEDFGLGLDNQGEAPLPVELGPFLSSAYRALLNVLALPLSPLGASAESSLSEDTSGILRLEIDGNGTFTSENHGKSTSHGFDAGCWL